MANNEFLNLLRILDEVDGHGDLSSLFSALPEYRIWPLAEALLEHKEYACSYGPTLLQSIGVHLDKIDDKNAARRLLLRELAAGTDSLVFYAAQRVILSSAMRWDEDSARRFYNAFESVYYSSIGGTDKYVASLALEGAVMLPIRRKDDRLLLKSIALLVNDFPQIPRDPDASPDLVVKALRLLGRCYDRRPMMRDLIVERVSEVVGQPNYLADAEARFTLGVIYLYDAFRADTENDFREALTKAWKRFVEAQASEEARVDAELFANITHCYLGILGGASGDQVKSNIMAARRIVAKRLLAFGGSSVAFGAPEEDAERHLFSLLIHLEQWSDRLSTIAKEPDLRPSLIALAEVYASVRELSASRDLVSEISDTTVNWVMLPEVSGTFVEVQYFTEKLTVILSDEEWRSSLEPYQAEFYELLLGLLNEAPDPNSWAAADMEQYRAAAEHTDPELAALISETIREGGTPYEMAFRILRRQHFDARQSSSGTGLEPFRPADTDTINRLLDELYSKLPWDYASNRWRFLKVAVQKAVSYHHELCRLTPSTAAPFTVDFLFAEDSSIHKGRGGLGKQAHEGHLEGDFYRATRLAEFGHYVKRQDSSLVSGRADLAFDYDGSVVFPIEVKCEAGDVSKSNIADTFLAQGQDYAASALGVGFLFVLDTTPKNATMPLSKPGAYCYIDRRRTALEIANESYQAVDKVALEHDWVVVMIFPANRYLPSDKTDFSKKEKSKRKSQRQK